MRSKRISNWLLGEIGNLDELIAQARREEAANIVEITWRGRSVPVRQEKVRLTILACQDIETKMEGATSTEDKIELIDSLLMNIRVCIPFHKPFAGETLPGTCNN